MDEIRLTCNCGATLTAPKEMGGKKVLCPQCGILHTMPEKAGPEFRIGDSSDIGDLTPPRKELPAEGPAGVLMVAKSSASNASVQPAADGGGPPASLMGARYGGNAETQANPTPAAAPKFYVPGDEAEAERAETPANPVDVAALRKGAVFMAMAAIVVGLSWYLLGTASKLPLAPVGFGLGLIVGTAMLLGSGKSHPVHGLVAAGTTLVIIIAVKFCFSAAGIAMEDNAVPFILLGVGVVTAGLIAGVLCKG